MLSPNSKTSKQVFVNIANIRRNFEKHAKTLFVSLASLELSKDSEADIMERKTTVTKCGRKASAIITVFNKSKGKLGSEKLFGNNKENNRNASVTGSKVKTTLGMEQNVQKVDLKVVKKFNLRHSTLPKDFPKNAVEKTVEHSKIRIISNKSIIVSDKMDKLQGNCPNVSTQELGRPRKKLDAENGPTKSFNNKSAQQIIPSDAEFIRCSSRTIALNKQKKRKVANKETVNIREEKEDNSGNKFTHALKTSKNYVVKNTTNEKIVCCEGGSDTKDNKKINRSSIDGTEGNNSLVSKEIENNPSKSEVTVGIKRRRLLDKAVQEKQIESPGGIPKHANKIHSKTNLADNKCTNQIKLLSSNERDKMNKNMVDKIAKESSITDRKNTNYIKDLSLKETGKNNVSEVENDISILRRRSPRKNKPNASLICIEIQDIPRKSTVCKRKARRSLDEIIQEKEVVVSKRTVNFDKSTKISSEHSSMRLRKRNVKYFNESFQQDPENLEGNSTPLPRRIPIYKMKTNDSNNEHVKSKKDVYKFTENILNESDLNPYDKDTEKIMNRIKRAENIAKRKQKMKEKNKVNRKNNDRRVKSVKQELVHVEIVSSSNRPNDNVRSYPSKISKNIAEIPETSPRVLVLAEVIVHAPISGNKSNPIPKNQSDRSLSTFDKLKASEIARVPQNNPDLDDIQVFNDAADTDQFNSPGPSIVSVSMRCTSPLPNNTPINTLHDSKRIVSYTSHIEPHYDRSNNFGFDEDDEDISPEKSILVHLNEVSRKLQKRTPWRNRLIVKNKRVLTVKNSSLPNVDQELILDSTIVEKLSVNREKNEKVQEEREAEPKQQVQTRLESYFETNAPELEVPANLYALFDPSNLSPIKQVEAIKKSVLGTSLKENLISTPRQSFRRSILQSKNQQSTPNQIEIGNLQLGVRTTEISPNKSPANRLLQESPDAADDLENSYFGFISPVNKKYTFKENVERKSPSKLPMRFVPADLRLFRKKYLSQKQRKEQIRKLEAKMKQREHDSLMNDASGQESDDEMNASEELPKLGLFDELLLESDTEEDRNTRKREKEDNETTVDRICRTKKKRNKKEKSEFDKWAKKFNEMCSKVDSHKLQLD